MDNIVKGYKVFNSNWTCRDKEKCYVIIRREMYCIDKIIGVFKKEEDAKCFIDLMNSKMTLEERRQGYYIMCETEMITDWRLESK